MNSFRRIVLNNRTIPIYRTRETFSLAERLKATEDEIEVCGEYE